MELEEALGDNERARSGRFVYDAKNVYFLQEIDFISSEMAVRGNSEDIVQAVNVVEGTLARVFSSEGNEGCCRIWVGPLR